MPVGETGILALLGKAWEMLAGITAMVVVGWFQHSRKKREEERQKLQTIASSVDELKMLVSKQSERLRKIEDAYVSYHTMSGIMEEHAKGTKETMVEMKELLLDLTHKVTEEQIKNAGEMGILKTKVDALDRKCVR